VQALRILMFCGLVLGLGWAAVTVKLGERTALEHLRAEGPEWAEARLGELWDGISAVGREAWAEFSGEPVEPEPSDARAKESRSQKGGQRLADQEALGNGASGRRKGSRTPNRGGDPLVVQREAGAAARVAALQRAADTLPRGEERAPPSADEERAPQARADGARRALRDAAADESASRPRTRTRVDERISDGEKAELDALLAGQGDPR
jgi:hypothetical protein